MRDVEDFGVSESIQGCLIDDLRDMSGPPSGESGATRRALDHVLAHPPHLARRDHAIAAICRFQGDVACGTRADRLRLQDRR
jgi:hypothetical protein